MWFLLYVEFSIKIQRVSLIHEVTEQFKDIIMKEIILKTSISYVNILMHLIAIVIS